MESESSLFYSLLLILTIFNGPCDSSNLQTGGNGITKSNYGLARRVDIRRWNNTIETTGSVGRGQV